MLLRNCRTRLKWLDRSTIWAGDPNVKVKDAEYSQDSKRMLEIDLKQEQVTIKHYRERFRQAKRSGEFALSEAKGYYRAGTR
jgi:bacterioferritin (cytochrome b1)